jgi:hypothetical protein
MNRIPHRISLGLNRTVQVKQVPPSVIAGIIGRNKGGVWDPENNTIWLDKTVSLQRKWKFYRHELDHALNDVRDEEEGGI